MSVMAVGLVWQAEIIAHQQEAIHWLETLNLALRSPTVLNLPANPARWQGTILGCLPRYIRV